jgi:ribosomal protein S18 acetylase RimI-like enzyme
METAARPDAGDGEGTMTDAIAIRPAREADLAALRALLVETWHDTYDALIGPEKVTEITDSWHSLDNLKSQIGLADCSFLVADDAGAIVGHAFANAQRPPVVTVARLYVAPARQRQGIGKRLLDAVVARHAACDLVRLLVEAGNVKGIAFYEREGFRPVGEAVVDGIKHFRMERSAAAA